MSALRPRDTLLVRFSLYGFLKNQQYYEPFFLLILKQKGLSYFEIGLLYSFREICVNLMGIPAGFLADLYGRRSSLVVCFVAYIFSFAGFALGRGTWAMLASMFAFAVGESFRSGTHKAMIFHHLRLTGRESEKAIIYGFTRSWSKAGSAISSLLSGLLVFMSGNYDRIFIFSIFPYLLNTANVATYPKVLEGEVDPRSFSFRHTVSTIYEHTLACLRNAKLRGLFFESAVLQALAKSVKDYVQPLVMLVLSGLASHGRLAQVDATRRSAFLLGILYFLLNGIAATASRNAHRFDQLEQRAFPWLWFAISMVGILLFTGSTLGGTYPFATAVSVVGFMILVLIENAWRPLFLDRLDDLSDNRFGAAVLSVEAQYSSLGVMLCAPIVGKLADHFALMGIGAFVVGASLVAGYVSFRRKETQPVEGV
jgi:MFS family permease